MAIKITFLRDQRGKSRAGRKGSSCPHEWPIMIRTHYSLHLARRRIQAHNYEQLLNEHEHDVKSRNYPRYRHLCTRFRIDEIKAMLRGNLGGKQ